MVLTLARSLKTPIPFSGSPGNVAKRLIAGAQGFWLPEQTNDAGTLISNSGTSGQLLDATLTGLTVVEGPTIVTVADADDYLTVPDEAALDITGDIGFTFKVSMDSWKTASNQRFGGKEGGIGTRSWILFVNSSGQLSLYHSADGTNWLQNVLPVDLSTVFTGGKTEQWLHVMLDVDDGGGNRVAKVWTGGDGDTQSWSQLGTDIITAATTSIFSSSAGVQINGYNLNAGFDGTISHFEVFDGIGAGTAPEQGTSVLRLDKTNINATAGDDTSMALSSGQTATISRATSGSMLQLVHDTVLLNTDPTVQTNRALFPSPITIAAHEDCLLIASFQRGNGPGSFNWRLLATGLGSTTTEAGIKISPNNTGGTYTVRLRDDGGNQVLMYPTIAAPTSRATIVIWLDRANNLAHFWDIEEDGTADYFSTSAASLGAMTPTSVAGAGEGTEVLHAFAIRTGIGFTVNDSVVKEIHRQLALGNWSFSTNYGTLTDESGNYITDESGNYITLRTN